MIEIKEKISELLMNVNCCPDNSLLEALFHGMALDAKKHSEIFKGLLDRAQGMNKAIEGRIMQYIEDKLPEEVEEDRSFLNMCAVDRWHMAESAWEFVGKDRKLITFGDLLWGFQLGVALHRMSAVKSLAKILLPIVCKLPFSWIYPTGEKQDVHKPTYTKYFKRAKWIAGDFLFINRNMPHEDMEGKIIVTNTTRE
ncbi:unnamed protein product [marine sediment metagenome]|uniref:Uncharacterized protein n=1 Tax=marine sediment metagenome TaxID=412755 RepID=X1INL4_9ZZZZ